MPRLIDDAHWLHHGIIVTMKMSIRCDWTPPLSSKMLLNSSNEGRIHEVLKTRIIPGIFGIRLIWDARKEPAYLYTRPADKLDIQSLKLQTWVWPILYVISMWWTIWRTDVDEEPILIEVSLKDPIRLLNFNLICPSHRASSTFALAWVFVKSTPMIRGSEEICIGLSYRVILYI